MTLLWTLFALLTITKTIGSVFIDNTTNGLHIQIFDNIAEISRPITPDQLPAVFTQPEWSDIRSDSIRLVGYCVTIRAQKISFTKTSINGQSIKIKRDANNDTYTDGIMIDETRNLVQDLTDDTFYTVSSDRIRYLSAPPVRNYSVDFVYEALAPNESLYLRYLQNDIKWRVRYDLLLNENDAHSVLQAYADISNDGSSSLRIDSAELISGDVNIRSSSGSGSSDDDSQPYFAAANIDLQQGTGDGAGDFENGAPVISTAEELAGLYIFSINETFTLDPRTNYILPMITPQIYSERYGLIEKYFTRADNQGNAQRAYRLRAPETFLPKGQVFVRESDRLVGESFWSDLAANETNEFTLGQDPDLQFSEYIQLNSRRQAYEANGYRFVLSTYTISLHLTNSKSHAINVEYRLKFYSQDNLTLKENTANSSLQLDGTTLVGVFELKAHDEQQLKFTFETK